MNKEKYLERRACERQRDILLQRIGKLKYFIEMTNRYKKDFNQEAKEALVRTEEYYEGLDKELKMFYRRLKDIHYDKSIRIECNHEILYRDSVGWNKEESGGYCPLCGWDVYACENTFLIGSKDVSFPDKWSCFGKDAFIEVIDYMVENDLDLNEEGFIEVLRNLFPNAEYKSNERSKVWIKKNTMSIEQ